MLNSGPAAALTERTLQAVESFASAGSHHDVIAKVTDYLSQFGFSAFGLTRRPRALGARPDLILNAWPEGWAEHYQEAGLYRHDAIANHALNAGDVFAWDEVPAALYEDPRAAAIPNGAAEFNMREGLCVPMPSALGMGSLWMGAARFDRLPGLRQAVRLMAYHLDQAVEALPAAPDGGQALTAREIDVLSWVAGGKTTLDIAEILKISDHTVGEHLKNIRRKLGTSNNTHSTVRALQLGLLRL